MAARSGEAGQEVRISRPTFRSALPAPGGRAVSGRLQPASSPAPHSAGRRPQPARAADLPKEAADLVLGLGCA